uniref:Uncharacterized protein n=1 Tax=Chloropicon primus TaxID=1764295 RepID=A0A7S2SWL2_9CHLO
MAPFLDHPGFSRDGMPIPGSSMPGSMPGRPLQPQPKAKTADSKGDVPWVDRLPTFGEDPSGRIIHLLSMFPFCCWERERRQQIRTTLKPITPCCQHTYHCVETWGIMCCCLHFGLLGLLVA